jgi:hypothetical protein
MYVYRYNTEMYTKAHSVLYPSRTLMVPFVFDVSRGNLGHSHWPYIARSFEISLEYTSDWLHKRKSGARKMHASLDREMVPLG